MTFLKQNWFKLIIGFGVIIFGFAAFYYLVIFLPQQAAKKECDTIASKKIDDDRHSNSIRLYPPSYGEYYDQCLKEKGL